MRNILARVSQKDKVAFGQKLKAIWLQPDRDSTIRYVHEIIEEYAARYPEAIRVLEEGLEDSLQFYAFGELDARKISSTNSIERLNAEIRRR